MKKSICLVTLFCLVCMTNLRAQSALSPIPPVQAPVSGDSAIIKFRRALLDGSYLKNPDATLGYAYTGLDFVRKSGDAKATDSLRRSIDKCYQDLIDASVKRYDYVHAYLYEIRLSQNKDSLIHEASSGQISDLQSVFESDKKKLKTQIADMQKELASQGNKLAAQEERESRNLIISLSVSALFLIILFFIFPGYLLGKALSKAHALKPAVTDVVKETFSEPATLSVPAIETKKSEPSAAQKREAEAPVQAPDSMLAARKIQQSLFASEGLMKRNLPDHFILDKPSEVVSGDFCWVMEPAAGSFYLCLADCKGHGVPGAFRSVLFTSFLNEAVADKKLTSPDAILGFVHEKIIQGLNPERSVIHPKEGMDAVLCMFDLKGGWLRFSCSKNPVWLIRNGELKEFAADERTVGRLTDEEKAFKLQTLGLRKGDCMYMFSNGFAKQTNSLGEKFGYQRMKDLLMTNCSLPMGKQQEILNAALISWQGSVDQVDDILVMGVRV